MSFDEADVRNEKFAIEVAARYHEFRRATLEWWVAMIRLVSLVGSIGSLLAVSWWVESSDLMIGFVATASVLVGVVNLVDLVFKFDLNAQVHTSLYQRFKALQGTIARNQLEWERYLPEWQAEAQLIRIDEPATYWAIYALAWNQTAERHRLFDQRRPIEWYQRLLGNVRHFRPGEFGFAAGEARPEGSPRLLHGISWTSRQMTPISSSGDEMTAIFEARQGEPGAFGPQTFADESDRARLSEVALKAFLALIKAWELSNAEAAALLGVSASTLDRMKRGARPALEPGPADPRLGARWRLQGAASSVRRCNSRRMDAEAQSRAAVRSRDADRGDDRRRHSEDA